MARFLDTHKIGSMTEEQLRKPQELGPDEFGVVVVNILYNYEADVMYCILDAPNKEAIEKHHTKLGYTCDSIMEIKTTA
ncbi:MAG: nickel-binding protein [Nitrososphaeraceae archaeon]